MIDFVYRDPLDGVKIKTCMTFFNRNPNLNNYLIKGTFGLEICYNFRKFIFYTGKSSGSFGIICNHSTKLSYFHVKGKL